MHLMNSLYLARSWRYLPEEESQKKAREKAEMDFLLAFKGRNAMGMISLIKEFPFLKDTRFKDPSVLDQIPEKHRYWCPRGWSPAQIASYIRDIDLLNFVLSLEMNIRSMKKTGGESVESNPLHISIQRDFKEGAIRILEFAGKTPYGRRGRFIDEKDGLKQTPWHLAIQRDIINGIERDMENQIVHHKIYYMDIVGRYEPSRLVSSYTLRGDRDGFEAAYDTGIPIVKRKADKYLVAPNYDHYKEVRENSFRHRGLKRPW